MYRSAFQMYEHWAGHRHCSIQTSSCSWNVFDFNIVTNAIAIGHHIVLESTLMWGSLQNRLGPFFLLSGLSVCVHWMGRIGVICYLLSLLSSLFLSVTPLLILSPNNRIELELQDITYRLDSLLSFSFPQTTVSLTWDAKAAMKMWRALLFMNHFFTTTSTVKKVT